MSPYAHFRKPCQREGCKGMVRRPDSIYCGRRCGFMERQRTRPDGPNKPVRMCERADCGKPITGQGKRFCGQVCAGRNARDINTNNSMFIKAKPKPTPVLPNGDPWWFDAEKFYANARARFPEESGDKSCTPIWSFGGYERDLMATGKERLRDRREREELR